MNDFQGIAMIIDEKINLLNTYISENQISTLSEKSEYTKIKSLVNYFEQKGIPLIKIHDNHLSKITKKIDKTYNVRLLILDLDLNGDGEVLEDDQELVNRIIKHALDRYGYFLLLIFSNHAEKWEDIKTTFDPGSKERIFIDNISSTVPKTNNQILNTLEEKLSSYYSLNLISKFESNLNIARDMAFREFIEFDTNTWGRFTSILKKETDEICHHTITNIFMSILKQNMIDIEYPNQNTPSDSVNKETLIKLYKNINYISNKSKALHKQPAWTGNLYFIPKNKKEKEFALLITPECDIAQNKNLDLYQIAYGFEINNDSFPDTSSENTPLPLFYLRTGKKTVNSSNKNDLNKFKNPNQYTYLLPFANENKTICIDFRTTESVNKNKLKNWKLNLRVIEPLIIDIINSYSKLYLRKGMINFDFTNAGIKLLEDE